MFFAFISMISRLKKLKSEHPHWFWIPVGVASVILVDIAYSVTLEAVVHNKDNRSSFGDYHNAINTLFTGIALVFVIYGVYVQHQENKKRDEEKKNDDVNRAREIRDAEEARLLDNFEERLFEMMNASELALSQLYFFVKTTNSHVYGRLALWHHFCEKRDTCKTAMNFSATHFVNIFDIDIEYEWLKFSFTMLYNNNEASLGMYFRQLYHVYKFIDSSNINENKKLEYAALARARLSSHEVFFLMLNGQTERGKKFKPLIEKYSLLRHLPADIKVINLGTYTPKAFNEDA